MMRCYEWLKDDGRFPLPNIPLDKNKGGYRKASARIWFTLAKRIGFGYHSTIIWNEGKNGDFRAAPPGARG
ncbi:MAG: hypothetical protein U0X93_11390 [Anaerolineales bacterium]